MCIDRPTNLVDDFVGQSSQVVLPLGGETLSIHDVLHLLRLLVTHLVMVMVINNSDDDDDDDDDNIVIVMIIRK